MSNKRKTRIPGRYERPAHLRAPLGDTLGEAGIRDGFVSALRINAAGRRTVATVESDDDHDRELEEALADLDDNQVDALGVLADTDEASRFDKLAGKLAGKGVKDPKALAAHIGRKKYGKTAMAKMAAAGRKRKGKKTGGTSEAFAEAAAGGIHEATPGAQPGTYVIDVIKSGWNKARSRHYPAEVLERDVPKVYPRGTQMFIDHPTQSEADDRPERSVSTLAAVFTDTPWAVKEDDGSVTMRTTARVFTPWQPLIGEAWPHIGVSINGIGKGDHGQREGHYGLLMEELTHGASVDFVTKPGAGGRVVGLLESAAAAADSPAGRAAVLREAGSLGAFAESRIHLGFTQLADEMYGDGRLTRDERITMSGAIGDALAAFVSRLDADAPQLYQRSRWADPDGQETTESAAVATREATAEQTRQAISRALSDQYATAPAQPGGPAHYCWYRDHDEGRGLVWFDASTADTGHNTWQQSYQMAADGEVELLGGRIEVIPEVVYRPAPPADGGGDTYEADPGAGVAHHRITETTDGDQPAGSNPGPAPETTKESDMGEKTADVVAREAAEALAATSTKERDEARAELARYRAGETARPILDRLLTESALPAAAYDKVRADFTADRLPLTESGALDETRLRTLAEASITAEAAYVAKLQEENGAGRVAGMGATPVRAGSALPASFGGVTREADVPDKAVQEALAEIYKRRGLVPEAAIAAGRGR